MARWILYIGDANPVITAQLLAADETPLDGTGHANPLLAIRREFGTANTFEGTGSWVDRTTGDVSYALGTADIASVTPGIYNAQWTDTDGDGIVMHIDGGQGEIRKAF